MAERTGFGDLLVYLIISRSLLTSQHSWNDATCKNNISEGYNKIFQKIISNVRVNLYKAYYEDWYVTIWKYLKRSLCSVDSVELFPWKSHITQELMIKTFIPNTQLALYHEKLTEPPIDHFHKTYHTVSVFQFR